MSWLYIIPIVIIVGALFIKKYKFSKKDIVNILFYGLVITFLALISTLILPKIIPSLQDHGFRSFFRILIMAGVVEEVAKFFGIKLSKPKNADQIFVFSILIALVFSVVEDFGYFSIYESGALFSRILTPIHLTFQLIMAYFLIKAFLIKDTDKSKAKLYTSLSLIVPILVHAIYDTYIGILIPRFVAYVVGVLTYVVVVVYILKMKTNNEISTSNDGMLNGENTIQPTINQPTAEKEKISIFKIIVIILLFLFFILLSNPSSKYTKVNTEKTIEEENIAMTVKGSDTETLSNELFVKDGNYVKVKLAIKNNSNGLYTVSFYSFHLLDGEKKINSESLISREDCLPGEISPNSTAEGYVYFNADKKDTYKLEYVAIGNGKKNTYLFDIK